MRGTFCVLTVALITTTAWAQYLAEPFAPDEHTTLLAHYDTGLDADYAVGSRRADGQADLADGRFGQGMYATKGWVTPEMSLLELDRLPRYISVTYAGMNLDPRAGCIEMMVWLDKVKSPEYFRRLMTYNEAGHACFLALRPTPENRTLMAYAETAPGEAVSFSADLPYEMDEQWHLIGMQWDAEKWELLVDGEIVASRASPAGGLPEPTTRITIGAHQWSGNTTEGIIDELRISDIPRYGR